jgi:dipeptidyl aminopeptidase/acylaminoacyl peptidase
LAIVQPVNSQEVAKPSDIPLEAFAQMPAMRSPQLSPDGSHLAYLRPINGRLHLVIQMMIGSDSRPVVVPPIDDLDFGWLKWANQDRLVFTVFATRNRRITETTETRLWAINSDGSNALHIVKPSRMTKTGSSLGQELPPAQLQGNVIHWLPDEPNHILLSLDADDSSGNEVRRINIKNADYEIVQEDLTGVQRWLADFRGEVRLGWGYRNTAFNMMVRENDGNWANVKKTDWWHDNLSPMHFSKTPDVLFVTEPDENGFEIVRSLNIRSGEFLPTIFEQKGLDVNRLSLDPVTNYPVGVIYTNHYGEIQYFDEPLSALQRAIDTVMPDSVNRIVSMTEDRQKILIRSFSDVDPGTYSFLDRSQNSLSFVAESMPGLDPEFLSPVESISYLARDELVIPGYITVPIGRPRENLATVVLPHGGPASRDDKSFWFLSQFLASRGFMVFSPNFRGSSGYGASFKDAGEHEWGGKMQEDVTDGTHWLVEQGLADPDNICIVGWSYGGYSAAIGAVQTPDLYQCAVSINGVLNLPRHIADDLRYIGGSVWTRHVGLEGERAEVVSPYHQAERIRIPMLIIQAKDDSRVHLDQGKQMARRLKRQGKVVEYVEVEFGGHSMTNEPARQAILRSVEKFLNEYLHTN